MTLTIYGAASSRTMRTLWLATELGLEFEHVAIEHDDPKLKEAAFLELNPFGTIPTIVDDGFALSESLAINLYLSKKYASVSSSLRIADARHEAKVSSWGLWAQGAIEPWVQRDKKVLKLLHPISASVAKYLVEPLSKLETTLTTSQWLLGSGFTLADLNVANVLSPSRASTLDLTGFPHLRGWLAACYARPAAKTARQRYHT